MYVFYGLIDRGVGRFLTWMNQWCRTREPWPDLFRDGWRWRIVRKSNAYTIQFALPHAIGTKDHGVRVEAVREVQARRGLLRNGDADVC
jgi:hypothetical protein